MEASTYNNTNPTLNHLNQQVYEQAQPPLIAQPKENQSEPMPKLNQAGSLAEPVAPIGLSTRQVQQGSAGPKSIRKCLYEAKHILKQGKIEGAGRIYLSIVSNTETNIQYRLKCAKKLLKMSSQRLIAANLLVGMAKDPNLEGLDRLKALKILMKCPEFHSQAGDTLVWMVKDMKLNENYRLKALETLAKRSCFQEKALSVFEAFSAVFESQSIELEIRDAAGDCVAPLLLAKAQDLQLWPLERIQAAKQLAQIKGQEDKKAAAWASLAQHTEVMTVFVGDRIQAAENLSQIEGYEEKAAQLLIAIAERKNDYLAYRIKAAKILSELKGQEARTRGNELLDAFFMVDLVEGNLPKRIKHAQRLSKTPGAEARAAAAWLSIAKDPERYVSNRCYAAEKLSSLPGQEASAAAAWASIVEDTSSPAYSKAYAINEDVRLSYCIKATERLAKLNYEGSQALAVNVLEGIKNDVTLKLSYRTQAAEALSRITQGDELVDFLFTIVQDLTALSFDRIEAAERLATLNCKYSQGQIWSAFLQHNLSYVDIANSMKIAKRLSKIQGYEAIAADWLIRMGRHARCYLPLNIQALKHLSKIPGYEAQAAELLINIFPKVAGSANNNIQYLNHLHIAEALSAIPGYEEAAATCWLSIAKGPTNAVSLAHAAQTLSRMPGQEGKTREAWNSILTHKNTHLSQKLLYRTLSARALIELFGDNDKAIEIFEELAKNGTETPDRRMLAVEKLARIPGQEAKVEELKKKLKEAEEAIANQIEAAKNLLQIPEKKEEAAQDLLAIAKNVAVLFTQRMLAIDILLEIPEQHPKAIEALKFISGYMTKEDNKDKFITGDRTLYQYHWLLAAEKLSKIPGQEEHARIAADSYVYKLSDESRSFKW